MRYLVFLLILSFTASSSEISLDKQLHDQDFVSQKEPHQSSARSRKKNNYRISQKMKNKKIIDNIVSTFTVISGAALAVIALPVLFVGLTFLGFAIMSTF